MFHVVFLSIIPAKSRRQNPGPDEPLAVQHPQPGCSKSSEHSKAEFLHFRTWSTPRCPNKLWDCCTPGQEQKQTGWVQACGRAGCMLVSRNKAASMRTKCRNNELLTEVQPWSCTVILCFLALSAGKVDLMRIFMLNAAWSCFNKLGIVLCDRCGCSGDAPENPCMSTPWVSLG